MEEYNPEVSLQKTPAQTWEMDVRSLVNSKKWLSQYGLRRSKLTLYQVLPVIGFKVSDGKSSKGKTFNKTLFMYQYFFLVYLLTGLMTIALFRSYTESH